MIADSTAVTPGITNELAPFDVDSPSRERELELELIREDHQVRRAPGVHPVEDLASANAQPSLILAESRRWCDSNVQSRRGSRRLNAAKDTMQDAHCGVIAVGIALTMVELRTLALQ
jgi:hypothetical protein